MAILACRSEDDLAAYRPEHVDGAGGEAAYGADGDSMACRELGALVAAEDTSYSCRLAVLDHPPRQASTASLRCPCPTCSHQDHAHWLAVADLAIDHQRDVHPH